MYVQTDTQATAVSSIAFYGCRTSSFVSGIGVRVDAFGNMGRGVPIMRNLVIFAHI
jgi:hypothetical protein